MLNELIPQGLSETSVENLKDSELASFLMVNSENCKARQNVILFLCLGAHEWEGARIWMLP